ncbi:MAG: HNH nuclease family protein [Deltaproteobacteria bacterium]|nr:HNH nuclease family protein [Deltaproteobacteria bacterium]
MYTKRGRTDSDGPSQIVAEARRDRERREKTYRERAFKIFPWICARCGREFTGKRLRELTVHHKDHNHDYNPPDGSNWELLCLYCHENEHSRHLVADSYDEPTAGERQESTSTYNPFADLASLLKNKK